MGKNSGSKQIDKLQDLVKDAIKSTSAEDVFKIIENAMGETFNSLSAIQKRFSEFDLNHDRSLVGSLSNALKPLTKTSKGNKYARYSKAPSAAESSSAHIPLSLEDF